MGYLRFFVKNDTCTLINVYNVVVVNFYYFAYATHGMKMVRLRDPRLSGGPCAANDFPESESLSNVWILSLVADGESICSVGTHTSLLRDGRKACACIRLAMSASDSAFLSAVCPAAIECCNDAFAIAESSSSFHERW